MRLKDAKRAVEVDVYENEIECENKFLGIEPGDMAGEMEVENVVDEMKKVCEWADKEERDWGYSVVDGDPIYCDVFGEPCETEKKFVMFYGRGNDEWKRVFDTKEEAIRECEGHWAGLVKEDKKNTTELFVAPMWCVLTENGWSSETYDKVGNTANDRDTEANFTPVFTIAYAGLSQTELAARMGISKAGLSNRISADTFREKDMEKVARAAGCEYVSYFQFPDGTKI